MHYTPDEQLLIQQVMALADARDPVLVLPHVYLWAWESDVVVVDQSQMVTEYEIKTGRADFKNDRGKHFGSNSKDQLLDTQEYGPNYFIYVVSAQVYRRVYQDLPDHAGLMVARKQGRLEVVREAPRLHSKPIATYRLNELYRKGYQRCRQLEQENRDLRDRIRLMNRHFSEERKNFEQTPLHELHQTIRRQKELIRDLHAAVETLKAGGHEDAFISQHIERAGRYLNENATQSSDNQNPAAAN